MAKKTTRMAPEILKSTKWGFTQYPRAEYVEKRKSGELSADGNIVKVNNWHGPLKTSVMF